MQTFWSIITILALSNFLVPSKTTAGQSEIIERLKAGGHILMVRHALAPGTGDLRISRSAIVPRNGILMRPDAIKHEI